MKAKDSKESMNKQTTSDNKADEEVTDKCIDSDGTSEESDKAAEDSYKTAEDSGKSAEDSEIAALKQRITELEKQASEYYEMLKRTAAEFDNYKKRTNKEKESLCNLIVGETVAEFLDFIDDIDRAAENAKKESDSPLKEGLLLLHREIKDVLKKLGVQEIVSVGEKFNPDLHCAVMHVQDENFGENEVLEEFKKGYMLKDRIIRHSVVKVAN